MLRTDVLPIRLTPVAARDGQMPSGLRRGRIHKMMWSDKGWFQGDLADRWGHLEVRDQSQTCTAGTSPIRSGQ